MRRWIWSRPWAAVGTPRPYRRATRFVRPRWGIPRTRKTWLGRPANRRAPRSLLLRRRRRLGLVVHHVAVLDGGPAFVVFVVLVFHDHADAHVIPILEVQRVVGARVSGEPVLAVDLLAIGLEFGELVVGALPDHAHALAVGLHDLQVPVVHPSLALRSEERRVGKEC